MVSTKNVCFSESKGEKSPTTKPFVEPEGMTTIDLNNIEPYESVTENQIKLNLQTDLIKIKILRTILLIIGVFLAGLSLSIVSLLIKYHDTNLNEILPLNYFMNDSQRTLTLFESRNEKLTNYIVNNKKKLDICKRTKKLEDCCDIFLDGNIFEVIEICTVNHILNLLLEYELQIDRRAKRQMDPFSSYLEPNIDYENNNFYEKPLDQAYESYQDYVTPVYEDINQDNNEFSHYNNFNFHPQNVYNQKSQLISNINEYPQTISDAHNFNNNHLVAFDEEHQNLNFNNNELKSPIVGFPLDNVKPQKEISTETNSLITSPSIGIKNYETATPKKINNKEPNSSYIEAKQQLFTSKEKFAINNYTESETLGSITENPEMESKFEEISNSEAAKNEKIPTEENNQLVLNSTTSTSLDICPNEGCRNVFNTTTTISNISGIKMENKKIYVDMSNATIRISTLPTPIVALNSTNEKVKSPHHAETRARLNQNDFDINKKQLDNFPSASVDIQSSQSKLMNPCVYNPFPFNSPYPYRTATGMNGNQFLTVVPINQANVAQSPVFMVNPSMYPYLSPNYQSYNFPTLQQPSLYNSYLSQLQNIPNKTPMQVSGTGGQYYLCNPISQPTNTIAGVPGVEVRQSSEAFNLKAYLEETNNNKTRESINCPNEEQSCFDGSKCLPQRHFCDNDVNCEDASDEMTCSCAERIGEARWCDGYPDCLNGEDEQNCFGCAENEFSCDDWSKLRKSTCIPVHQRCDGVIHCDITGKDEEDCSILTDRVGEPLIYQTSNAVGFLYRNYKGKWYPTCFGSNLWALDVCKIEAGPSNTSPKIHMMLINEKYEGPFISILSNNKISLVDTCIPERATFVECPPLFCGLRMTIKNPYRSTEVDTSSEDLLNNLERTNFVMNRELNRISAANTLGISRVVGGKASQPAAWPWVVSIYKNGEFHCGGVLINESWIITAAHCVAKYWQYYYEIQAGMLRRFSYSPMEQIRWAKYVIPHEFYHKKTLRNDIALMKLSSPIRFNRYVRPICLPSESTAGRNFLHGPSPGTICTTVGWGATVEHGIDPDHMREVEIPVLKHCRHTEDEESEEICAGLTEGGRDACQGDSGGPFMCRNSNNPTQWYLAGIVSHGEGCARPNEPGVYTKVSRYINWIAENTREENFVADKLPLKRCPGYSCKVTNKCLSKKKHCDKIVDCLIGDDEFNCGGTFTSIFKHSFDNVVIGTSINQSDSSNASLRDNTSNESSNFEATTILYDNHTPKNINNTLEYNNQEEFDNSLKNNDTNFLSQYFRCTMMLQLILIDKKCNKIIDCEDGSDELHCSCVDYVKKVYPQAICDGITDCKDVSDEMDCVMCSPNQFFCRVNRRCIPLNKRCDGTSDCAQMEDEWDCIALTNGATLTLDRDLRPNQNMNGIITINRFGVWRPLCTNTSDNTASIATNVCNLLGFEEYTAFHIFSVKDKPLNVTIDGFKQNDYLDKSENMCSGLFIQCSNISLGRNILKVYQDNITREVELYVSPWNAMIYADGKFRCMGTIVDMYWIVTSLGCFQGILMIEFHYVAVLLGRGKGNLDIEGPHEQIQPVIKSIQIGKTDIVLLRLQRKINFNRYIQPAYLKAMRNGHVKSETCITVGFDGNKTHTIFFESIKNCSEGLRCFKMLHGSESCVRSNNWSGTINCDSRNGWYPAAVFSNINGSCHFEIKNNFTSVGFIKQEIQEVMSKNVENVELSNCNGFRCLLGECIDKNKICNTIPDCRNGEDEEINLCGSKNSSCHLAGTCICQISELKCKNGKCISKSSFCDGIDDCGDNSDEPNTCSCRNYLQLVSPLKNCDGTVNCKDRSDESPEYCECKSESSKCGQTKYCISSEMICDGFNDCPNGEDENLCYSLKTNKKWSNAGEVMKRTAGVWHSGCFDRNLTISKLEEVCEQLGFIGGSAKQLTPPNETVSLKTLRPVMDRYSVVLINQLKTHHIIKLRLRTGNEPYLTFKEDSECYKLFIECM